MESASNLLQLVQDARSGAQGLIMLEDDLIGRIKNASEQLLCAGLYTISPESSAIAVCHVTAEVTAFLVEYRPLTEHSKWHKRVLVLETAVASAVAGLVDSNEADLENETRDLNNMVERLFRMLWKTSDSSQSVSNKAAIMTKLCMLLGLSWLSYDRMGSEKRVENLLILCSDLCAERETTIKLAKWPLFLLGIVHLVEKQDVVRALGFLRRAVEKCEGLEMEDGIFFYWYAVALIRNGIECDATAALDKCIQCDYKPAPCLYLQAIVQLQASDYHAARNQLQRLIELDFTQPSSMFNYALLMERMSNFSAEQQMLKYILEFHGNGISEIAAAQESAAQVNTVNTLCAFDDQANFTALFPSRRRNVTMTMVHRHAALAAMENGCWLESKYHFEEYLSSVYGLDDSDAFRVARDYVYVLLQSKLPSLALRESEQYLQSYDASNAASDSDEEVTLLLLHLYKADALLCLERVSECCKYLQEVVQPRIQKSLSRREAALNATDAVTEEIISCHTQLVNNVAVAVACCSGADPAMSILRVGLQQYPDCLAMKFNLVLLLLRTGDEMTASALWMKARGWNFHAETNAVTGVASPVDSAAACQIAAVSASAYVPFISEHVQGNLDGECGVSAQQLVFLDALIIKSWRKRWNSQLADNTIQFIEYLESRGSTDLLSKVKKSL
ncbi:hypothetical protein CCR75_000271 [Bremia lactucae]|uniref:Uncharacterized protein n=1 Tax=Bremia lactucae TaxID=4779 RepID=A0A976FK75_BRELC|nr:hypothetical protein CCR75_000271 [Bremia lactucae]